MLHTILRIYYTRRTILLCIRRVATYKSHGNNGNIIVNTYNIRRGSTHLKGKNHLIDGNYIIYYIYKNKNIMIAILRTPVEVISLNWSPQDHTFGKASLKSVYHTMDIDVGSFENLLYMQMLEVCLFSYSPAPPCRLCKSGPLSQ